MKHDNSLPPEQPESHPLMELFRYGHLPARVHYFLLALGAAAAFYWLHFAVIKMALLPRLMAGETLLLDAIVGFPLVLAMAIVVYGIVFWFIKLVLIMLYPHWLTLPPDHYADGDSFDPADPAAVNDLNKPPQ
jgi:hypothetical protein